MEPSQREALERPGLLAVQESPIGFLGGHLESFQPFFANTMCSDSLIVDVFLANQSIGPQAPTLTISRRGLARTVLLLPLAHSTVVIEHAHALTTPHNAERLFLSLVHSRNQQRVSGPYLQHKGARAWKRSCGTLRVYRRRTAYPPARQSGHGWHGK
jgi:hypothetical protein